MPLKKLAFGKKEEGGSISKFKGVEYAPSIMSVIDKDGVLAASLHYTKGIGSFHCFDGICCAKEGAPRVRYVIPVVSYRIKNLETREINFELGAEVQYVLFTEANYEKLIKINDAYNDIDNMDLLFITEDENFGKYKFEPILDENTGKPRQASWRQNEKMRSFVLSFYENTYLQKIGVSLGREINAADYLNLKNQAQESNTAGAVPPPPAQETITYNSTPPPPNMEEGDDDVPFEGISDEDLDSLM